jgi:hypothetical protein
LGFYSKDQKTFGGATPGNPSLATSSHRKQDQENGQVHPAGKRTCGALGLQSDTTLRVVAHRHGPGAFAISESLAAP